jgi:phosphate starvation-inducible PhoH-like protein
VTKLTTRAAGGTGPGGRRLELTIEFPIGPDPVRVLGVHDRNVRLLREGLGVSVTPRGGIVRISGQEEGVRAAERFLRAVLRRGGRASTPDVLQMLAEAASGGLMSASDSNYPDVSTTPGVEALGRQAGRGPTRVPPREGEAWEGPLAVYSGGRQIRARTPGQAHYLEAIRTHELVFGMGPAGTGKTYLAVAAAVHLLRTDRVRKLVLVRPAVEAGERLGFLPGDMQAKVHPYLRPLLDALYDMMDVGTMERFMESGVIEIAPLAFMRGRTLNQAAILLDEAQNSTIGQMQMFLTRMGEGSRMIVTGDPTQVDIDEPAGSGLVDAARRLRRVRGVAFATLTREDVVRHALVQRIIDAYGGDEPRTNAPTRDAATEPVASEGDA